MVTSSIMKDTTAVGVGEGYRANAIRSLCRIIDASTVQAIERNLKTAIVDKNPSVSSAALVSSYHLLPIARDIVRRWQSETQEAASSSKSGGGMMASFMGQQQGHMPSAGANYMAQYHAIGLLYQMRSHGESFSLTTALEVRSWLMVILLHRPHGPSKNGSTILHPRHDQIPSRTRNARPSRRKTSRRRSQPPHPHDKTPR